MADRMNLRAELEALRREVEAMRKPTQAEPKPAPDEGAPLHLQDLHRMVQDMLDEAEETVVEHPVATVAGALALGIVIGRLTAR